MDRELLLEIGCEELPASWLPDLTKQIGAAVASGLAGARLNVDAPIEAYSTPRRLTVCNDRVAERQTDLEEVLNGPPVSAAFSAAGEPTPAALGFARRHGVEVSALEQVSTAKGPYLAFRKHERGKPSVDVLPDVLAGVLRALSFPRPCIGMPGSTMAGASCCSDVPFGGFCSSTADGSCPSRSGVRECAVAASSGRPVRRRHVRASIPDDQRSRRTSDQGTVVRGLPSQAAGTFRRARPRRATRPYRS